MNEALSNPDIKAVQPFSRYVAWATGLTTLITFSIAFLTPPLSGPFCEGDCFSYPYHDITSRFPRDYFWMYPAMLVMILFPMLMACIHEYADQKKKVFSLTGLCFSIMASVILIANYFVQVSVVQPSLLKGETAGIALITQYNPHGVFIALEEIGFFLITLALVMTVPVFPKQRALNTTFIIGFVLSAGSFLIVSAVYGLEREYIFEIVVITLAWTEMIVGSFLLARVFKSQPPNHSPNPFA